MPVQQKKLVCPRCGDERHATIPQLSAHIAESHMPPVDGPSAESPDYQHTDTERLNFLAGLFRVHWCDPEAETVELMLSRAPKFEIGDTLRTWVDRRMFLAGAMRPAGTGQYGG